MGMVPEAYHHVDMSSDTRVVVMEYGHLQPGMDLLMYLPAVITCIIELGWQGQVVGFMSDTGFNCEWAKLSMGQFGQ
jgi:hypothetical protein